MPYLVLNFIIACRHLPVTELEGRYIRTLYEKSDVRGNFPPTAESSARPFFHLGERRALRAARTPTRRRPTRSRCRPREPRPHPHGSGPDGTPTSSARWLARAGDAHRAADTQTHTSLVGLGRQREHHAARRGVPAIAQGDLYTETFTASQMYNQSITPAGGSQPHENTQPFLCINFIISLFGVFPTQT